MDITPQNICDTLINGSEQERHLILTEHLQMLGRGIVLLQNPPENKLLPFVIDPISYYLNLHGIEDLDRLEPFIELWFDLMEAMPNADWLMLTARLPERLRHRISVIAIYESGKVYSNAFPISDVFGHLKAIVHFRDQQPLEPYNVYGYTKNIDYSNLRTCLNNLLSSNLQQSWRRVREIGNIVEILYTEDDLKITLDNLSLLIFEIHYLEYSIYSYRDSTSIITSELSLKDAFDDSIQHLKLPKHLLISDLSMKHVFEYLEYNYKNRCPPDFFPQLKLYMTLMDVTDISLDMLKFVYTHCTQNNYKEYSNVLPAFE